VRVVLLVMKLKNPVTGTRKNQMNKSAELGSNSREISDLVVFGFDPEEELFNERMTEENWELLKKMPNNFRLVVDNVAIPKLDLSGELGPQVGPLDALPGPQELTTLRLKLHANGYHPVPVIGKAVKMPAWQTKCLTANPQQISNWSYSQRDCTGTGIICGEIVGVDIDVLDAELSAELAACAQKVLGPTSLQRIGKAPKTLLVYRVETPHEKHQTPELLIGEVKARVEILAKGQQFVGFGIHPDTKAPYTWLDQSPLDIPATDVPLVTLELLQKFLAESEKLLRAAGGRTAREIKEDVKLQEQQGNAAAKVRKNEKPSREKISNALDHIVNDLAYLDWIRVGLALYDGLGEGGRDLWESWSATYPDNDPDVTADKWKSFANGRSVKIATLFWYAKQNGWWWKDGAGLDPLIDGEQANAESDIDRMNKVHAILPIGSKTRVVTFGELPDFPGRETIVMTQTFDDFRALQSKYRHTFKNEKGEEKHVPMGHYWLASPDRRQYDGGMAFMPQHDGNLGNRLNLFHGFGVKAIKPNGMSGAAGCDKFLDFMLNVICNGDEEHFQYLVKREATIFQKRIRSEIALGLRTKEEGCGKGFYEFVMGRLLGTHSMQVTNPKHIVGNFNPHLETLLRLTADEALFVGSHEHRNALFSLITESKLTIEPKGYGVYQAHSFLNISITSNADHFLPVSGTARRFFIPTVSTAHMQDFAYFNRIQAQLDDGGYEALLHHLLYEVDLAGFNVRLVPQTAGLREQRDQSLAPLESWWCELLETGTLAGADPDAPERAVSNAYQREVEVGGTFNTQIRLVNQLGLYDQAKLVEPRLKHHTSDHKLGSFLKEMGCDNKRKVLRHRGWTFPPLLECRAKWESRYPDWQWRDTEITEWQAEESDEQVEIAVSTTGLGKANF
jgi:hypothetical protein